jgi:hypothetical protein
MEQWSDALSNGHRWYYAATPPLQHTVPLPDIRLAKADGRS